MRQRTWLQAALSVSLLAMLGPENRHDVQAQSEPPEAPLQYNYALTPWLYQPLDAQAIAHHYTARSTAGMAIEAWPLLVMTCSPTVYGNWESLPTATKNGAVERQRLCQKTLSSKNRNELNDVLTAVRLAMARTEGNVETQGRYRAAIGMSPEDADRIEQLLKEPGHKGATEEEAMTWILRQSQQQMPTTMTAWARGRTIGPYSRATPWSSEVNISPEEALTKIQNIVNRRGLVGLRLPLGWAQSPNDWVELSHRLDRIAGLVETRSRLGQGSFGLWGKVMLEWRVADRVEASAVTLKAGNFYAIQASETAVGHEWFHAYSHWSKAQGNEDLQDKLIHDLRRVTYNRWQIQEIFRQSHQVLAKEQAAKQWMDALQIRGPSKAWDWEGNETLHDTAGKRPSLFWYAQAAWTLSPRLNPDETPWISRRRALDETLQANGWTGRGIVRPGYYIENEEISAAAFQGILNLDMAHGELLDTALPNSLVGSPLPVESQAMRQAFTRMFRAHSKRKPIHGWDQSEDSTSSKRAAKD